jgi:peptidoglycan/LPS O-acetylase OafA/YrhL
MCAFCGIVKGYSRASMSLPMRQTYFPGLQALRFYAALSVIVYHLTAPATWFGDADALAYAGHTGFIHGHDAVSLFFVLSGFLIITLLVREKAATGTIGTRRFYLRRAFRILPLYYLTVLAGACLALLTAQAAGPRAAAEASNPLIWIGAGLFFYSLLLSSALPITHLWSLNVEEQFYLIAPHLIRRARHVPVALSALLVAKLAIHLAVIVWFESTSSPFARYLLVVLEAARFEAMAIGGLAAYLVFRQAQGDRHVLLRACLHPIVGTVAGFGLLAIIFRTAPSQPFTDWLCAIVFMLVIVHVAVARRCWYRLETPLLRRLGDLSYAMYMAHAPVLWLLWLGGARGPIYVVGAVGLTLLAAFLLYNGIERPFMRWRDRQTVRSLPVPRPSAAA